MEICSLSVTIRSPAQKIDSTTVKVNDNPRCLPRCRELTISYIPYSCMTWRLGVEILCLLIFRRVHKIAKSDCGCVLSVCLSAWNNSAPTGQILKKFDIWEFFGNLSKKFKFHENPPRITSTVHKGVFTFMTISRWILLRMRNVLDKTCRENQNTHFMFSTFLSIIVPFMRKCRKNWCRMRGHEMTVWCICVACWISKAKWARACFCLRTLSLSLSLSHTHTHTHKYGILIAFPRQQLFHERASILRYTHIACLSKLLSEV
jgi:hypothetical protein